MQIAQDHLPSPIGMNAAAGGGKEPAARNIEAVYNKLTHLVSSNAVVVFTMSGCCMCHVVKQLLFNLGVGPTIVELDRHDSGRGIYSLRRRLSGNCQPVVPAVFVGGKFLGGLETVMACHINGALVPLLKDAGGLWL